MFRFLCGVAVTSHSKFFAVIPSLSLAVKDLEEIFHLKGQQGVLCLSTVVGLNTECPSTKHVILL